MKTGTLCVKIAFICGFIIFGLQILSAAAYDVEYRIVRVEIVDPADVAVLSGLGAIWEIHSDYVITEVTDDELESIRMKDFRVEMLYRAHAEYLAEFAQPLTYDSEAGLFHSYAEIEHELYDLASAHPLIAKVFDLGDSHEGRNIVAIKISDNVEKNQRSEPDILFLGGIHAREWIAVEVPFYLAKFLVENYDDDQVKNLVDNGEIWIVPMVNPDGHQYSIDFNRMWRKNRRYSSPGCYGVDLNRNFGFKWGGAGTSSDPRSPIYRGPAPFSEPENQTIQKLGLKQRFNVAITYHSYGEIIYYPWSHTSNPAPDEPMLDELADDLAADIFSVRGKAYEINQCPLASGSSDDWIYGLFGVPSYGFEMDTRFTTPESEIIPIWEDQKPACLRLIEWAEKFPVRLKPKADAVVTGDRIRYIMLAWNTTSDDREIEIVRETQNPEGDKKDVKTKDMSFLAKSKNRKTFRCKAKPNMSPGSYTHRVGIYDSILKSFWVEKASIFP